MAWYLIITQKSQGQRNFPDKLSSPKCSLLPIPSIIVCLSDWTPSWRKENTSIFRDFASSAGMALVTLTFKYLEFKTELGDKENNPTSQPSLNPYTTITTVHWWYCTDCADWTFILPLRNLVHHPIETMIVLISSIVKTLWLIPSHLAILKLHHPSS